jgi:isocitrate/isopropylmalate dehydrogenase
MEALITVLPGDGIGPQSATAAERHCNKSPIYTDINSEFSGQLIGGAAIDAERNPCPQQSPKLQESDAIMLGAGGGQMVGSEMLQFGPNKTYCITRRLSLCQHSSITNHGQPG